MKLLYFDDFKLGVLKGDTVVDVSAVVQDIPHIGPHDLINGLIERFAEYREHARGRRRAAARACPSPACASGRRCRSRTTSTAWRSTTWKTARAASRRRSTPSTSRPTRSSATATRWCCRTCRPRSSRARPSSRVVIGKRATQRQRGRRHELRLRLHQLHRRLGARPAAAGQHLLSDEVARHLRADRPVPRHRRRDRRSAQAADQAVGQRRAHAELQHRRHGAQDPALHRVGHRRSTRWSPATSSPPAPTIAA